MAESENDFMEENDDDFFDVPEEDASVEGMKQMTVNTAYLEWNADTYDDIFPSDYCKSLAQQRHQIVHQKHMGNFAKFPGHMTLNNQIGIGDVVRRHALPFLPAKTLCRFRVISKDWDQWINSPFFSHKQTLQFKDISGLFCQVAGETPTFIPLDPKFFGVPNPSLDFLPEPVNIRVSCNGLLCCQSPLEDNAYYICNPVTKEWTKLPKPNFFHGHETAIALAFEPAALNFAAHYELVCAFTLPDNKLLHFEIYSSRSSSWRLSNAVCSELHAAALTGDGIYMKGNVYWETDSCEALAFDVKNEDYGFLVLPAGAGGASGALTEWHGELCYIVPCNEANILTIKIYGDMTMGLKNETPLSVDNVNVYQLHNSLPTANGSSLGFVVGNMVIAYHSREEKVECLSNSKNGYVRYLPYVNNFVPVRRFELDAEQLLFG